MSGPATTSMTLNALDRALDGSDALSKDALSKDALSKDALSKDALSKDALSKDALSKDALSKGARTRAAILSAALVEAGSAGLSGLSFGRLASAVGMSKSGLFAHFKGKEELQLAVLEEAQRRYAEAVIRPSVAAPRGLPRLWALCQAWLGYAEGEVFSNGCFFSAVAAEFDNRPGPVRARIATLAASWTHELARAIEQAQARGHLHPELEPRQLAFELHALMTAANAAHQLLGGPEPFVRSWRAIRRLLREARAPGAEEAELSGLHSDEAPALAAR